MGKAWDLLGEMQSYNILPDNFTYSTLIKGIRSDPNQHGHLYSSDLEKAFSLLSQMKKANVVQPDEVLYNCLIDACVRFRDVNRAVAVF